MSKSCQTVTVRRNRDCPCCFAVVGCERGTVKKLVSLITSPKSGSMKQPVRFGLSCTPFTHTCVSGVGFKVHVPIRPPSDFNLRHDSAREQGEQRVSWVISATPLTHSCFVVRFEGPEPGSHIPSIIFQLHVRDETPVGGVCSWLCLKSLKPV